MQELAFAKVEDDKEAQGTKTGMEGNSARSEDHVRGYDVTDMVLEPLINDIIPAVLHEIIDFYQHWGGREADVAMEHSATWLGRLNLWISIVMKCLIERETKHGHQQKCVLGYKFQSLGKWIEQMTVNIEVYN